MKFPFLVVLLMMSPTACFADQQGWKCSLRVTGEGSDGSEKVYPGNGSVAVVGKILTGSFFFKTFSMSFEGPIAIEKSPSSVSGILSKNNKVFDRIPMSGTYTFVIQPNPTGRRAEILHLSGSQHDLACISYDLGEGFK
jgi:hypothetical protein